MQGILHVSNHSCSQTGLQREACPLLHRNAVDRINLDVACRNSQSERRVSQQRVLQFVGCLVLLGGYQLILCQSHGLAYRHGFSCLVLTQHKTGECHVHQSVITLINGSCRTIESNGSTFIIEESSLTNVLLLSVVWHNVTRGRYPQRQAQRIRSLKIVQAQDILVRNCIGTSVT